jgi:sulfite exporter TauE/SafE
MTDTNLLVIFLTGLTTGGLTCLAVQGGLLASVLSPTENKLKNQLEKENKALPIASFIGAKLISHTLLGILLGFLGASVNLSPSLRGWFQVVIGLYLVGVALSLLDAHPFFRYFIITPPKFLSRLIKNQSRGRGIFAPALLGAMTVFIPCATTQAMAVLALGVGNPLYGAAIMFSFILGTSPTFFILGFLFSKMGERFSGWFGKVAATLLITMAIFTINGGVALMGSIYTLENFVEAAKLSLGGSKVAGADAYAAAIKDDAQEVTINVSSVGYSPNKINLKLGVPTKLTLITNGTGGCARAFTIPGLKIQKVLPVSGSEVVEFIPKKAGPLVFTCSMGMYSGVFNVI